MRRWSVPYRARPPSRRTSRCWTSGTGGSAAPGSDRPASRESRVRSGIVGAWPTTTPRRPAVCAVAGIAVVTAAAGFLIEDPRQRSVVVGAALLAAVVWVLLGVLLERTIAAAPP